MFSPKFDTLTQRLRILQGVGPKSAQRMALSLLLKSPDSALELATALADAIHHIKRCQTCRSLTELNICEICSDKHRDTHMICVVESPADIIAIEQSGVYRGLYFVLGGKLSPLDGIGPKELGLHALFERLTHESIEEMIIATNATVEGEATANYIQQHAKQFGVTKVSRLAQGVPQGGEIEYIDSQTLGHALKQRLSF